VLSDRLQVCANGVASAIFSAPVGTVAAPAVAATGAAKCSDSRGSRIPGCRRPSPAQLPTGPTHFALPLSHPRWPSPPPAPPVHTAGADPRGRRSHWHRSDARHSRRGRIEEGADESRKPEMEGAAGRTTGTRMRMAALLFCRDQGAAGLEATSPSLDILLLFPGDSSSLPIRTNFPLGHKRTGMAGGRRRERGREDWRSRG
jgi:hypothetical protein